MSSQPKPKKIFWTLLLIFIFLSLGIWIIGYLQYVHQVAHIKHDKQNDLAAIMDLKIQQIVNWRNERIADAKVIRDDPFFAQRVKELLEGQETAGLKTKILRLMQSLTHYQYQNILLIDKEDHLRLSFPREQRTLPPHIFKLAAQVIKNDKIIFSDLYADKNNKIRLSLLAPILEPNGGGRRVMAVISLGIDPHQFLYPLIQSWPTASRTAEILLLHRQGNKVVFLNELRHRQCRPLSFSLPINSGELCAVMAAHDKREIAEGPDYRGIPVVAAGDRVPDSPWFLLAKVDQQEIFQPIAEYIRQTTLLLLALVGSAGLGLAYVWRNQQAASYRQQFEMERDKLVLAQRYEYLTQYANDIIILADQEMRLLEANDRAVEAYGYARDELLQLSLGDLHPEETRPLLEENLRRAEELGGLLFETSQQRKDGTIFPAEISLRLLELEGRKVYQAIIRNVTQRRLAEEALRRSEASLAEAQRIAHLAKWEWDLTQNKVSRNAEGYRIFGQTPQKSPFTHEIFLSSVHPDDLPKVKQEVEKALTSGRYGPYDYRIVWRDGTVRFLHSRGEVSFDAQGRPLRMVGTAQDITEQKHAEEALRESEENLRYLTKQLLTAQEAERQRVSLMLHDELGQALMLFKFQLSAIRDNLRNENSNFAKDCQEVLQYLDGLIDKVRQLSQDLNPPGILAEVGFQASLNYLIEGVVKNYNIQSHKVVIDEIEPLFSKEALINIYRIIQECLINIGRHARASRITVEIKKNGDQVACSIRDNGEGFDSSEALRLSPGLGLPSMKERVRILGGSFNLWSKPGAGTRVSFKLPVREK